MSPETTCSPDTPVEHARALIGTKFRLHGRDVVHGLDCVGLIARVYGWQDRAPFGYSLRGENGEQWVEMLDALAARRADPLSAGDIVLLCAGPMQYHLGIWSGSGLIHADAGVRRVVETPGALRWPVVGAWFKSQDS